MKKVTVYTPSGKNFKEFNTDAKTWRDLQPQLRENQVDYSGMKAVIGETRLTVESDEALLPETDFTLFLMPVKVKSGNERSDLFDLIKALVAKDPSKKQLFIIDGKNMTQLSTPVLAELWKKHGTKGATVSAPAPVKEEKAPKVTQKAVKPVANVADVVATVADNKAELEAAVEKAKKKYQIAVANDVDEETQDILLDKLTAAKLALKGYTPSAPAVKEEPKETEAQRIARELKEAEIAKKNELYSKAQDIAKGFKDLKSFS